MNVKRVIFRADNTHRICNFKEIHINIVVLQCIAQVLISTRTGQLSIKCGNQW